MSQHRNTSSLPSIFFNGFPGKRDELILAGMTQVIITLESVS